MVEDKRYFETHKYRDPDDYVVRAFVEPKLRFIEKCGCFGQGGASVLDVGAGNGTFGMYLGARAGTLVCADYSMQLLSDNPAMLKVRGDAYDMPFFDKKFDVVFEANLLHHLDDPHRALKEMARCSRDYIVLIEPNRYNPLMFLFSLIVRSERGVQMSYKKRWEAILKDLKFDIVGTMVTGMITQQNTPACMVPLLRHFDFNFFLGEYVILVGKRHVD